ncbi:hypothetical protein FKD06_11410 [Serratia sp. SRS-8-S-2018]|uniref:LptA/OstA family protein n=1 Tax=Serratia sp. SRS-8-S-2018 TaxID=2591107 RepID=UPI00113FDBB3|nr:LptA/OstA family protein [Serratia sp. SRS-8-S-2018]TPW51368.1 hypothetical protein FKD06_11410 [Serratia sp. SRS-8-S-2018]
MFDEEVLLRSGVMFKMYLSLFACGLSGGLHAAAGLSSHYTIKSDKQKILPNGDLLATGHVHVVSGDMIIDADEATYNRTDPTRAAITAIGTPIKYSGKLEDGTPFTGRSRELDYWLLSGDLSLRGEAFIQHRNNTLSAAKIDYNVNTRKLVAASEPGRRVTSVIYPDTLPSQK